MLYLWMVEELSCTISTSQHVPKVRYRAHALKIDPLPIHFTKLLKRDIT